MQDIPLPKIKEMFANLMNHTAQVYGKNQAEALFDEWVSDYEDVCDEAYYDQDGWEYDHA